MTKIGIVGPIAMSGMKSGFEMSVDFDMHWWFSRNSPGSMRYGLEDHGPSQLRFHVRRGSGLPRIAHLLFSCLRKHLSAPHQAPQHITTQIPQRAYKVFANKLNSLSAHIQIISNCIWQFFKYF